MDRKTFHSILQRYLAGKASRSEQATIDEWYASFPSLTDREAFSDKIKERQVEVSMYEKLSSQWRRPPLAARTRFMRRVVAIAAVLLLVTSAALLVFRYDRDAAHTDATAGTFHIVETGVGQVKRITLPDSSVVWLNAKSTLRVPAHFARDARTVYLDEGEASFDVTPDPEKPFSVRSGILETNVLGTQFNVRNYHALPQASVRVAEGKVQVADSSGRLLAEKLIADQQLVISRADTSYQIDAAPQRQGAGWQEGQVRLRDAPFAEVALMIENIYGVRLQAGSESIGNHRYNITISMQHTLEKTLAIICSINGNQYRRDTNGIIVLY